MQDTTSEAYKAMIAKVTFLKWEDGYVYLEVAHIDTKVVRAPCKSSDVWFQRVWDLKEITSFPYPIRSKITCEPNFRHDICQMTPLESYVKSEVDVVTPNNGVVVLESMRWEQVSETSQMYDCWFSNVRQLTQDFFHPVADFNVQVKEIENLVAEAYTLSVKLTNWESVVYASYFTHLRQHPTRSVCGSLYSLVFEKRSPVSSGSEL